LVERNLAKVEVAGSSPVARLQDRSSVIGRLSMSARDRWPWTDEEKGP